MCKLCGQHVTFTNGTKQKRHFRHNSAEQDKDCEDRTQYSDSGEYSLRASDRELPLRLKVMSRRNFELQLGLPPVPELMPEKLSSHKIIISCQDNQRRYVYSFERISENSTTYLPVGNIPCEQYTVTVVPAEAGISPHICDNLMLIRLHVPFRWNFTSKGLFRLRYFCGVSSAIPRMKSLALQSAQASTSRRVCRLSSPCLFCQMKEFP